VAVVGDMSTTRTVTDDSVSGATAPADVGDDASANPPRRNAAKTRLPRRRPALRAGGPIRR